MLMLMLRIRRNSSCMFAAQHIMGYYTIGSSSHIIRNDPPLFLVLDKGFQWNALNPHSCTTFINGSGRGRGPGGRGGIAIGTGFNGFALNLKGCLRDEDNIDAIAFHKGKGKAKGMGPRAFAPQNLQLLPVRDLEIGLQDGTASPHNATATANQNQQHGASHHGRPLGFPDRHLPDKIVVAVDVDEVLGNFVSALNRFIADRYFSNHSISEYHVYEFFKIWNCSRDEADIRVHEFFKTPYFKTGIHPIPGARRALHTLSRFCNLSVVTSRQNAIKDHTIDWIEKHYPGLFQEIHFGNHFALDGVSRPKSEICRSLGANVLIDDNPRYAIECAEIGIRVLLFDYENSYPWCKTESVNQHPLVTKVHNWAEVEKQLMSWIVS
ncbi:hypothetical protein F2P56_002233 [Juglans regia]|uniref:Uncharacterized protein n=2 Tax=Juglans regia TaxID=51240 RepID=A0A834D996_JUGRE|nr:uncharacterized protein LOC108993585 [Juglans regia]KAF5481593.1 hypothetical protein F2P56_002233 [Juglans regia]